MTQNIYDQPDFFEAYSQLRRSVTGLDGAPEWPAIQAMLPDPRGLGIVDLGCGFGWFCRWARDRGATRVLGLDVSERMLARARAATPDPASPSGSAAMSPSGSAATSPTGSAIDPDAMAATGAIVYGQADLERLDLPDARFDLAYSSLALHYVEHPARLFAVVHRALVPGGRFVFSTEHPILMAPSRPDWSVDADGRRIWPLDRYHVEGPRTTDWLAKGVVKHHRTIATTLNLLIGAGFTIRHVEEFCPTPEQIAARPELERERDRPTFLLVAAQH